MQNTEELLHGHCPEIDRAPYSTDKRVLRREISTSRGNTARQVGCHPPPWGTFHAPQQYGHPTRVDNSSESSRNRVVYSRAVPRAAARETASSPRTHPDFRLLFPDKLARWPWTTHSIFIPSKRWSAGYMTVLGSVPYRPHLCTFRMFCQQGRLRPVEVSPQTSHPVESLGVVSDGWR